MSSDVRSPSPLGSARRVARFTAVMYKPHYLLYGILFVLALEGTAALVSQPDTPWRPGSATVLRIVVVAFVLLYLRMVDEQKDLDYDRVHNPDRPLVTGAVSAGELRAAMGVIAVGAIGASLGLSVSSAVAIAVVLAYGVFLWALERRSAAVRDDILLNLVVTYPVQLLVAAYVLVSASDTGEVAAGWQTAAVVAIFAAAFLQFEFARKTARERRPGEHLYSNRLGVAGSIAAILGFAVLAVAVELAVVRPWEYSGWRSMITWIPLALLSIPVYGEWRFLRSDEPDHPVLPAVGFVLALYVALIAQALLCTT
ncbi:UbiA family prenyltransferase [Nocardia bhagyanarayanae]|uniref:UbiA prenyltransferase family protein n=1 Tax=Nocardia bhagyanarayanae TaxID=1215925 RepID=A0A543EVN0_9NOCA|nr:UbiA family prenyltransferase [Nocardia bhagyanarayanae]TQM25602.1 UbiA prenyltransferase family protein [Nocardia bhagyanarayanae]